MPMLYIMCGVAFSGKTTLAKAIAEAKGAELVSLDAITPEETGFTDDVRAHYRRRKEMGLEKVAVLLANGKSVVYDSVNTKRKHRDEARAIAAANGASAVVVFVDTPNDEQDARRLKNTATDERHHVSQEDIDKNRQDLERPGSDEETFVFTPGTDLAPWLARLPENLANYNK
jgi:predicted kinase